MIIGNLGKDPVLGYNTSGRAKCSLSVAVTERYKDANGEQKEATNWFNVVFWGGMAETIKRLSIKKGTCVFVSGKMSFRSYQDQDGQTRYVSELLADNLQILTPRQGNGGQAEQGNADYVPF
jgi:single-strand DNA-binding protein